MFSEIQKIATIKIKYPKNKRILTNNAKPTGLHFAIMAGDILNIVSQRNNQTTLGLSPQKGSCGKYDCSQNILKGDYHAVP